MENVFLYLVQVSMHQQCKTREGILVSPQIKEVKNHMNSDCPIRQWEDIMEHFEIGFW
jgi:hypothetical protein